MRSSQICSLPSQKVATLYCIVLYCIVLYDYWLHTLTNHEIEARACPILFKVYFLAMCFSRGFSYPPESPKTAGLTSHDRAARACPLLSTVYFLVMGVPPTFQILLPGYVFFKGLFPTLLPPLNLMFTSQWCVLQGFFHTLPESPQTAGLTSHDRAARACPLLSVFRRLSGETWL